MREKSRMPRLLATAFLLALLAAAAPVVAAAAADDNAAQRNERDGARWWYTLIAIAALNSVLVYIVAWRSRASSAWQKTLATVFYASIAFRSVFMSDTVAHICIVPSLLSAPLVNRTVAACGEIAFAVVTVHSVALALRNTLPLSRLTYVVNRNYTTFIALGVAANLFSHTGIVTGNSGFLVIEEALWLLHSVCVAACYLRMAFGLRQKYRKRRELVIAVLLGVGYAYWAYYLYTSDIPMYWRQYVSERDAASSSSGGGDDDGSGGGGGGAAAAAAALYARVAVREWRHAFQCERVTRNFDDWRGVYWWHSLYFTFGPLGGSLPVYYANLVNRRKGKNSQNKIKQR